MRGITGYTLVLIDGRRQGIGGEVGPNGLMKFQILSYLRFLV